MQRDKVRFGLDFCPATKNMTNPVHCRNCDFRGESQKDCCECNFGNMVNRRKSR